MRIILQGISQNQVMATLDKLWREGVRPKGGGTIGEDGLVLVDDKDTAKALEVLARLAIGAHVG